MQKANMLKRLIVYATTTILALGTIATVPAAAQGKNAVTSLQVPVAIRTASRPQATDARL